MYSSGCTPGGVPYTPLYVHAPVFVPSNAPVQGVPRQDQQQYPSCYVSQARQQMVSPGQVAYPTPCSSPSRLQPTRGIQPFYGPSSPPSVQGVRTDGMLTTWQGHQPPQVQGHPPPPLQGYPAPPVQQTTSAYQQPQTSGHQPHFQSLQPCPQPRPQPPADTRHQLVVAQSQPQHLQQYKYPQPKPYTPQQPQCNRAMYYSQTTSTMVSYTSDSERRGFGGNPSIKNQQAMYQKQFVQSTAHDPNVKECILPLTSPEKQRLLSQFRETLSIYGKLDVCDHHLLSIFMQLPASIRRGIKRLGGLKVFLAEEFRVEGDNVSLREASPAFQDDRSYDPAEWVESKTEDFLVTEFMKEPPVMKNRSEDVDDGNLLEICSFLSDHYGDGGGYYDDYKALYPGGQPSFESPVRTKDKSPYSNLGNKLAAKAKQEKAINKSLVTNTSVHIIDHQDTELKVKTSVPSSHSQRSSPSPYVTMGEKLATKAQEVRSGDIGKESNQKQHSNVVRQKHLFVGDLLKRNDSYQSESQEINTTSSAGSPKWTGDASVRPRMASMLSGHSTVEEQTDWILHLRSLADVKTWPVKNNELPADTEMVESLKQEAHLGSTTASKLADPSHVVGVKTELESDRERALNLQTLELPRDEGANEQTVQLQSEADQDGEHSASTTQKLVTQQTDVAEDTLEDIESLSSGGYETRNEEVLQASSSDGKMSLNLDSNTEDDNCSETGEEFGTPMALLLKQESKRSLDDNISGTCIDCVDETTTAKVESDQINIMDDLEGDLEGDDGDLKGGLGGDLEGDDNGDLVRDLEGDLDCDLEYDVEGDLGSDEGDLEGEPTKVLGPTETDLEETQVVNLQETLALAEAVDEPMASLTSTDNFDMNALVFIEETPLKDDDQLPDSQLQDCDIGQPDQTSEDCIIAESPEANRDCHKDEGQAVIVDKSYPEVEEAFQPRLPLEDSLPCLVTENYDSSQNLNAPFASKLGCIVPEDEMTQEDRCDPFHSQSQGHEESRNEALDSSLEEASDCHEEGKAVSKSQSFLPSQEVVPGHKVIQSQEVAQSQEIIQSQEVAQSQEAGQSQESKEVVRSQEVVQSKEVVPSQEVCISVSNQDTESVQHRFSVAASLLTSNTNLIREKDNTSQKVNAPLPVRYRHRMIIGDHTSSEDGSDQSDSWSTGEEESKDEEEKRPQEKSEASEGCLLTEAVESHPADTGESQAAVPSHNVHSDKQSGDQSPVRYRHHVVLVDHTSSENGSDESDSCSQVEEESKPQEQSEASDGSLLTEAAESNPADHGESRAVVPSQDVLSDKQSGDKLLVRRRHHMILVDHTSSEDRSDVSDSCSQTEEESRPHVQSESSAGSLLTEAAEPHLADHDESRAIFLSQDVLVDNSLTKTQPGDHEESRLQEEFMESEVSIMREAVETVPDTDKERCTAFFNQEVLITKIALKTKDRGVNTDEIHKCTRAVSTRKDVERTLGVNTDIVIKEDRGVDTPTELEEAYMQKYVNAVNRVKVLEATMEIERSVAASQKKKHSREMQEAVERLHESKQSQKSVAKELQVRRHQQTAELTKTTMELRELQGRFSNAKTKIFAGEKLNSSLSSELESVTRQLLDLEASSLKREMEEVKIKHSVETDTQELDEARDMLTAERLASLTQRAKTAELKVLEMKHQALEEKIASTLSSSSYTYNIYAESSKISMYEKNQLASRFAAYEDTIKGHVSKLQSDYEALVQMIQHEDKAPDQLHELKIPSIDTFAVSVPRHGHVNLYQQGTDSSSEPSARTTTLSPHSDPSPGPASEGPIIIGFVDSETPSTVHGGGLSRHQRVLGGARKGRGRGRRGSGTVSGDNSPIRPGHHALQEGEDTLQAHPTKPAPKTQEADEMLSNRPLPDPTQQPRTDLPETPSGPGAASMPPGLRTPAGGSDGPPGLTENQSSETKASKAATVLTRAERIRNMQRIFSSGSSLSRLRSKFSEGLSSQLHMTLGSHSGEFSARRLNAGLLPVKQPAPQVASQGVEDKVQQLDTTSEGSPTTSGQGQESHNPVSSASSSAVLATSPDHEEVNKKADSDETSKVATPLLEVPREAVHQEVSAPSQHVSETNQPNHQQPHQSHQQAHQHQSYRVPSQPSFYPPQRHTALLPTPPPPLIRPQHLQRPAAISFDEQILFGAYQNQQRKQYFHGRSTGFPPIYPQTNPQPYLCQMPGKPPNRQGTASTEPRMPQDIASNPQKCKSNVEEVVGNPKDVAGNPKEVAGNPKEVAGNPKEVAGRPKEVAGSPKEVAGNPKEVQQMPSNPQVFSSCPQMPLHPSLEKPLPGVLQHDWVMEETVDSVPIMLESADRPKIIESGNPGVHNLDDSTEPEEFEALLNQEINDNTDADQRQEAGITSSRSRHLSCGSAGPRSTTSHGNLVFGTSGVPGPASDQNASSSDFNSCGQNITAAQRISMEWKAKNRLANTRDVEIQSKGLSTSQRLTAPQSSVDTKQLPLVEPDIRSHHATSTFFQQKTADVNTRSFNFTSDRSNKANLPPRFQAQMESQKKQAQKQRLGVGIDHIAPLMSVLPGMAKAAGAEPGLKKRKSRDASTTEEDKTREKKVAAEEDDKTTKEEAKKAEADEWQTQMSKRKKRAMAQQAEQKQQHSPAGKAMGGSLDKLVGVLSKQFANVKMKELLDVIRQVRMDHKGSLSGIPLNTILAESKLYLKTKREQCQPHQTKPQTYTRQDGHTKGKELPTLQAIKQAGPLQEAADICVICQDDMSSKGGNVRMLDCGHLFHDECISKWYVTRERTCPVCRCHTLFVEDFPRLQ